MVPFGFRTRGGNGNCISRGAQGAREGRRDIGIASEPIVRNVIYEFHPSILLPFPPGFPMRRLPIPVRRAGVRMLESIPVTIRGGPNAGRRWSLVSSGRGYLSGRFEADRVAAILALLRPGDRFWDVGAHKGYLSLAAARVVGPAGGVAAMEPSASNRRALERHLLWNSVDTVRVLPFALSDTDGEARFGGPGSSTTWRLGRGDEMVRTRTIRALVEEDGLIIPQVMKIDAEGAEAAILRGGLEHLSPGMLIWISVHSRALYDECRGLLESRAFSVRESAAIEARTRGGVAEWGGDKELLAVGKDRTVDEDTLRELRLFGG